MTRLYEVLDCSIRVFACYISVQQFFLTVFNPTLLLFKFSIWYTLLNFHSFFYHKVNNSVSALLVLLWTIHIFCPMHV